MALTDWRMKGEWVKSCNCAFGCPCDFNARPTQGYCKGMMGMLIKQGHFGQVRLDGLKWAVVVDFPGALYEGNGTIEMIIDERADAAQRDALLAIFSGKHSQEGTLFDIVNKIVTKVHGPIFAPIEFSFDLPGRKAHVAIPGVLETETKPIRNPVTGSEHRIRVVTPEGFEHREAEVASALVRSTGAIPYSVAEGHGSLAQVEHTPAGIAA
jgi:hypothetical protein